VHSARLKELASIAESASNAGKLEAARDAWLHALDLLPEPSQQNTAVQERITALTKKISEQAIIPRSPATESGPWWKRGIAGAIAVVIFALSKFKFLLLGLTKASTFVSMFAFFGVYWTSYGWPLALGLVISIYIHEMGHVAMLKRLGIHAGAPLFIPGLGALVLLKQRITDPDDDAKIGLAGPVWGLAAGLIAYVVYVVTDSPTWAAIAQLTGYINLFNLIPVWQLDGSRGFHALTQWQRAGVVAAIGIVYVVTSQGMLLVIGAVAAFRALQRSESKGNTSVLATFVILIAALSALAAIKPHV